MEFVRDNYLAFLVVISVVLFFIIRDTLSVFRVRRLRTQLRQDVVESEKRMDELVKDIHVTQRKLDASLLSIQQEVRSKKPSSDTKETGS